MLRIDGIGNRMQEIGLGFVSLSLVIWLGLLVLRGGFWRSNVVLEQEAHPPSPHLPIPPTFPPICAVIPARNEAELLPATLRSLLSQTYSGAFTVFLVDDHSSDGTAAIAQHTAAALGKSEQLQIIAAQPLPAGWSGKLWAMHQGIQAAKTLAPTYVLLTDADIEHDPANLQRLVTKAEHENLDLASVMVRLRCESCWEQLLIPAFVFFFEKLYPFRWVNDPNHPTAAAAGGCILIRQTALDRIGGIASIRQALIDDCALAQAVKGSEKDGEWGSRGVEESRIWLGLSDHTRSLRPYPSLATIWDMVARTAFTQLNYSFLLLAGTVTGMSILYLAAPIGLLLGWWIGNLPLILASLTNWFLITLAYWPTVRFYRCHPIFAVSLPLIALLYTLMTVDSAIRYWQGRGGAWKGRVYPS